MRGECLRRAVEGLGKSAELKRGTYPNASGCVLQGAAPVRA